MIGVARGNCVVPSGVGTALLLRAPPTIAPVRVVRDGGEHFAQCFPMRRAAQVKDSQARWGLASLQKCVLNRLAKRMGPALPNAKVAQPLQDLPMVGGDDQELRVFQAQD